MADTPPKRPAPRPTMVIGAMLVVLAVSGYFMGLRQTGSYVSLTHSGITPAGPAHHEDPTLAVPTIVSYPQLDRDAVGPNAGFASDLRMLVQPLPPPALTNVSDAARAGAIAAREARRAFDGAPPIVPHPIPQESSAACLACHGPGLAVKDRVASKISHAHYSSCTQCHVAAATGPQITTDTALLAALADNVFVGAWMPARGSRAWEGAPPTVPHTTLLRSDCNSCHGPQGLFGLRTPHPERQSCSQCHVPDAVLDQRPMLGSVGP